MIKQFLKDVEWGELDFLIIDSPPGTGDEPLAIIQLLENADGAVVVTTPQEVAISDVRKGIAFCRSLDRSAASRAEEKRCSSGTLCSIDGCRMQIMSAVVNASGYTSWKTLRMLVLERGSKTAIKRWWG